MRNFKKFLALVLAMLMVSACAVSVSAAFTDQAAVNASGHAEAVALLEDLGIVQGDENKNFNPENTLRRDEAAVMVSKLVAGAAGQSMDWTAATTKFADVDAEWSFAYINYVADRKIMVGTNIGFEPTRELQIDEALALALKAADPAAVRDVEIEYAQAPTAYWATYYIDAAEDLGLTADLGTIYDYEAPCTRAMFARIAYNMINYTGSAIGAGFGYNNVTASVTVDDQGIVTITDITNPANNLRATASLFNAVLAGFGYTETAADLDSTDSLIKIVWLAKSNAILDVEILTNVDTVIYSDNKIALVKKADGKTQETTLIEIDGVKYTVGGTDSDGSSDILGAAATPVYGVELIVDGTTLDAAPAALPAYYKATLYDFDGDGEYDEAVIKTYSLAVLTKKGLVDHDSDANTDKVEQAVIAYVGVEGTETINEVTYSGITSYEDAKAPVLLLNEGKNIDVIEVADTVTGKVTNIKAGADGYVTIDKAYGYAAVYVAPASWVLGQNVTIYTIGGKYVSVAAADTGVESGMVEKTVRVDNVVVENGNAIVTGYLGNSFEEITLNVVGVFDTTSEKLIAKTAYEIENKVKVGADGKLNAEGTEKVFPGQVFVGAKDDKGEVTENWVEFVDGASYTFCVTSSGAYYKAAAVQLDYDDLKADFNNTDETKKAVEVKNGYIYINGTAKYKMASSFTVVTPDPASDTEHGFYDDTYTVEANKALVATKFASLALLDADYAKVAQNQVDKTVSFIYVLDTEDFEADDTVIVDSLADGQTIVQIVSKESESLDYNTYNAIDLFTGAKVTVTGSATDKAFYVVNADGKIAEATPTAWVGTHTSLEVSTVLDMTTVKAKNTKLVDGVLTATGDAVEFGIDAIKAYQLKDGVIDLDNAGVVADALAVSNRGYIDNGTMIILYTPASAE